MGTARGYPQEGYRSGARPYRAPGGFQPPAQAAPRELAIPDLKPVANDNALGGPARAIALFALRRVAPRLIPGLNLLSYAYDLYQWYTMDPVAGWNVACDNGGWGNPKTWRYGPGTTCGGLGFEPLGNWKTDELFGWEERLDLGLPGWFNVAWSATRTDGVVAPLPAPGTEPDTRTLPSAPVEFPDMPPYVPYETPYWWPSEPPANDPFPMKVPERLPWRALPYRTGVDYWLTVRGPQVSPRPRPVPEEVDLEEIPDIRKLEQEAIKRAPQRQNSPRTNSDMLPVLRSRPSVRAASRPAGRGRKELKIKLVAPAIAKLLINSATETCDFVGALFQAIPLKQRLKDKVTKRLPKNHEIDRKNPTKKMQDVGCPQQAIYIYKKLNDVAVDKAIKNLIVNELIDRGIGKVNQKVNAAYVKANKGTRVGIGFGPTF